MSARKRREALPAPPPAPVSTEPRWTELIGLTQDGRMVRWSEGNVVPVSRFEMNGEYIECGHYVLDWAGHAITVYCGNFVDGRVSVQVMCSTGFKFPAKRREVERMLIGKVVPDPEEEAAVLRALQDLQAAVTATHDQPHRQRGRIS